MLGLILSACGVKKYLPEGPVLKERERAAFEQPAASGVAYTGEPVVALPVIPVQVWGVFYDLDLVLESTHDRYDMHEMARVQTPEGPVWLAKDALAATKLQSIVADLPDLASWVPELPIARKEAPVTVVDRSEKDWLDLEIRYENLEGEPAVVTYAGKAPWATRPQSKRNGNTMGHSAAIAMAALDIPHRAFARSASVTIDGQPYKIRKLLGLVGIKVSLVQAQGGLAVGRIRQAPEEGGFTTTWELADGPVTRSWAVTEGDGALVARQEDPFRTLSYTWRREGESLELQRMTVEQYEVPHPVAEVVLDPALPDLRRRFEGRHRSRFVVDVNGSPGKAVGWLEAYWEGDEVRVDLLPEEPEWVTDRPMRTTIGFEGEAVDVVIERVPAE